MLDLSSTLQQTLTKKNEAMKVLGKYSSNVNDGMQREGQRDVQFFEKLLELKNEASAIRSDLKDKEKKIYRLQEAKDELDKTLEDLTNHQVSHPLDDYDEFLRDSKKTCQDAIATRKSIEDTGKYLKYKSQQFSQLQSDIDAKSLILAEIELTK